MASERCVGVAGSRNGNAMYGGVGLAHLWVSTTTAAFMPSRQGPVHIFWINLWEIERPLLISRQLLSCVSLFLFLALCLALCLTLPSSLSVSLSGSLPISRTQQTGLIQIVHGAKPTILTARHAGVDPDAVRASLREEGSREEVARLTGLHGDRVVMAGVERVEKIKGVWLKLLAFEDMLRRYPDLVGR